MSSSTELKEVQKNIQDLQKKPAERVFDLVTRMMAPAVLALGGWLYAIGEVQAGHSTRLFVLEATQFTREDGHRLIETLRAEFPPLWLKDTLSRIEEHAKNNTKDFKEVNASITQLKERLTRIETSLSQR